MITVQKAAKQASCSLRTKHKAKETGTIIAHYSQLRQGTCLEHARNQAWNMLGTG